MIKKYDFVLRPHHVKSLIVFKAKKSYYLSENEYIKRFKQKNKGYHTTAFIKQWRSFLLDLCNNSHKTFMYTLDFDTVCSFCDIKKECSMPSTKLHSLVENLDQIAEKKLPFKKNKIYSISELDLYLELFA